jgi:hypothetical protein
LSVDNDLNEKFRSLLLNVGQQKWRWHAVHQLKLEAFAKSVDSVFSATESCVAVHVTRTAKQEITHCFAFITSF